MVTLMNVSEVPRRKYLASVKAAAAVILLAAVPWHSASAHAMLRSSIPSAGGTLRAAPAEVWLTFSETIDSPLCAVRITDAAGKRVDLDNLHGDPDEVRRLIIGLSRLPPGAYRVEWKAVSIDTHRTEGSYGFIVLDMKPQ
jgi:methionine-rich copper-binding protein CopC